MRARPLTCVAGVLGALALWAVPAVAQQDLGHRLPGTLGLDAGSQPPPGVYLVPFALFFGANEAANQQGQILPIHLNLDTLAEGLGIAVTLKPPGAAPYLNFAISMPVISASLTVANPKVSVALSGIGDLFVQPLKLGWRWVHADLVAGYGFYAPTGSLELSRQGTTVSGSEWTQEPVLGGTIYFDHAHSWRFSALTSYDINSRKEHSSIRRGQALQVQGGLGTRIARLVDLGVVGYGAWQTTGDTGSALSKLDTTARDRAYGLGAEVGVVLTAFRSELTVRYVHDLGVESGVVAQVVFVTLAILATDPVSP